MPRYIKKSHGFTIGSGMFSMFGPSREIFSFPYILSFQDYRFEQYSTAHVNIETPAVLLFLKRSRLPMPTIDSIQLSQYVRHYEPAHWFSTWLDNNAPGWAMRKPNPTFQTTEKTIFLQKRAHALAICKLADQMLEGAPTLIHPSRGRASKPKIRDNL